MSAVDNALAPEQRAKIAELIGDAKPATPGLLVSFGESVRDRREHDHPTWEDLYCLNLSSYMGERMAPVLRRLLDAEALAAADRAEVEMLRARVAELAAERADRQDEVSAAVGYTPGLEWSDLVNLVASNTTSLVQAERDVRALRARTAELEQCQKNQADNFEVQAALIRQAEARVAELEAVRHTANEAMREDEAVEEPTLTVYRASHDSIVMGLYTTREAARQHCEANVRREEPEGSIRHLSWWTEDVADDDAEYELHITPAETGGLIRGTGYVVTPLEVAAEYDPDGDE
ncbi:hypothetical protein ACFZB5_13940 [Streptomyces nodosus]|uniref:hypothetical protein n=1 Tax=Streptomyces nodosus TaxID=40318 RepID=UPI0036EA03E3